jgi:transposase InsO family protein
MRPGGAPAPGAPAPEDAEPDPAPRGAPGAGVLPGLPGPRSPQGGSRAREVSVGRDPDLPQGVYEVLHRHGLSTRRDRLGLVAGYAAPPEQEREPEPERHIEAPEPGSVVGMDYFYVGRLSGTKGTVWQYTAIDVHSGFCWAELHTSDRNPREAHASGWLGGWPRSWRPSGGDLHALSTDNGSEFRNASFTQAVTASGAAHRLIQAGRPTSNGAVERVQRTILEGCWRPSFARSLVPKLTALRRDLEAYLDYYQLRSGPHQPAHPRAHAGRGHRSAEDEAEVSAMRRYISEAEQPRTRHRSPQPEMQ